MEKNATYLPSCIVRPVEEAAKSGKNGLACCGYCAVLPTCYNIAMREALCNILAQNDWVDFAVLFGSMVSGRPTPQSDLDIAVATTREVSFLELGTLVAQLEIALRREVDLVIANDLPSRNPVLAFAVASGELLFARDKRRFVAFKERAFLSFWDTEFLRNTVNRALLERLARGRFGKRAS